MNLSAGHKVSIAVGLLGAAGAGTVVVTILTDTTKIAGCLEGAFPQYAGIFVAVAGVASALGPIFAAFTGKAVQS